MLIPQRVIDHWRSKGNSEKWIQGRITAFNNDVQKRVGLRFPRQSVEGCEGCLYNPHARGMCKYHYGRWWRRKNKNENGGMKNVRTKGTTIL